MDKKRLPDTPWHVGYAKKEEDDPRRHKHRCTYYKNGVCKCGHCGCYTRTCGGSSHCTSYTEGFPDEAEERLEQKKITVAVQSSFGSINRELPPNEKVRYKGKQYLKIYITDCEAVMIPYEKNISQKQINDYIRTYLEGEQS